MKKLTRVLFCGKEFPWSFRFTKEALAGSPGIEVLQCDRADTASAAHDAHVLVPFMAAITDSLMQQAPELKLVIQYGVGVEGVDIPAATRRGIWVSNIPSTGPSNSNALSCAEMAIYLMLATLRQQNAMRQSIQQQRLGEPLGQTLYGKTVLVVGFGNIARELIPRLQPFGARLMAVRRSPWGLQPGDAKLEGMLHERGSWSDLHALAAQADLLVLTCVQNEQTRGMVNASLLAACKPGVRVVNVARGGLLNHDDVLAALDTDQVAGLGLDVAWSEPVDPESPLAVHPKVVWTPHVAGVTELSYRHMAKVLAREVLRVHDGLPPAVQLNQPRSD